MVEGEDDNPYIDARMSGDTTVWIDMIHVPKQQRGQGIGTRYYREWEAKLPKTVKLVRLLAADTGSGRGNSDQFWELLGFNWQYKGENLDYEAEHMMWKGVNGHPTPATVDVDAYDDDS
jgi:predicted GNAT superfamily acetyltransferase